MYIPADFDASDRRACHELIRSESFGLLVSVGADGVPMATHLPFLLDPDRGPFGTLRAHLARGNPQWQGFAQATPALAVFSGAHAYVSPAWYTTHPSVPTWNYVAVHAAGIPRVIEEPSEVRSLLASLVEAHEGGRPAPWRMASLPPDYLERMIRGIVAFEMPIDRLEGKAKLSQNRSQPDQAGVISGLLASGDPGSTNLAALMTRTDRSRPGAPPTPPVPGA